MSLASGVAAVALPARLDLDSKRRAIAELDLLSYQKAGKNLEYFFRKSWRVLEPQTRLLTNWHQGCIAEYLTAARQGQVKRLIVNIPPRYTKSLLCSVAFPAWVWTEDPHLRFMSVSYSGSLATKHSMDRRTLISSPWYQQGYRDAFALQHGDTLKTRFSNDKRGHMIATSMLATGTGLGGNFLLFDDPHDTTRAASKIKRERDLAEFDRKWRNRLDDKENGVMVIVMQRLDEMDLTGHVCDREGTTEIGGVWTQLKLPATAPERVVVQMPISKTEVVREQGDVLHEARQNAAALAAEKEAMGSYDYAGQYDQEPAPREGGILKKAYWRYYTELPQKIDEMAISVDCTFTDTSKADFVAIGVWARKGPDRYLVDLAVKRLGFAATCHAILAMRIKHPKARRVLIEKKANGDAVIETLRKKISGILPFPEPGKKMGSKEERAEACTPELESGCVYLPGPAASPPGFVADFIMECARFPRGKNDDRVDQFTQIMLYWASRQTDLLKKLVRM